MAIFLGFPCWATAGQVQEPTEKANPTNHMHPGRRRCFYLAAARQTSWELSDNLGGKLPPVPSRREVCLAWALDWR